ncbi:MAG: hypothetical protein FWD97_07575 [Defluviitaleaceae bacterium]|nr:hypothetical protein [Defluviitaleaceae bacterium]
MKKWIVGIIIVLIFIGLTILNDYLNWGEEGIHIISFIFVISLALIFGTHSFVKFHKQEKAQQADRQTIIPQNVDANSYVDEKTGAIHLRSTDYDRKSGQEWIVTKTAITIKFNNITNSQTIFFSTIQRVNLNPTSPISQLSFSVLKTQSHFVSDGIFEDRIVEVTEDIIHFFDKDIRIAEAIRNRVAGLS